MEVHRENRYKTWTFNKKTVFPVFLMAVVFPGIAHHYFVKEQVRCPCLPPPLPLQAALPSTPPLGAMRDRLVPRLNSAGGACGGLVPMVCVHVQENRLKYKGQPPREFL